MKNKYLWIKAILLIAIPGVVYGYFDPATASIVGQMLAACALGVVVFVDRVRDFFVGIIRTILSLFKKPK